MHVHVHGGNRDFLIEGCGTILFFPLSGTSGELGCCYYILLREYNIISRPSAEEINAMKYIHDTPRRSIYTAAVFIIHQYVSVAQKQLRKSAMLYDLICKTTLHG